MDRARGKEGTTPNGAGASEVGRRLRAGGADRSHDILTSHGAGVLKPHGSDSPPVRRSATGGSSPDPACPSLTMPRDDCKEGSPVRRSGRRVIG